MSLMNETTVLDHAMWLPSTEILNPLCISAEKTLKFPGSDETAT